MLHVTNGDSAGALIEASGVGGVVVPWRDVLHEGPVPAGLTPEELREVRARFLADRGWAEYADVLAELARRDEMLASFRDYEEVVLWFEHDLYDQLQLVQILDRFAGRDLGSTTLTMICIGAFPGVTRFRGLGLLSPQQIASLFPRRRPVSSEQLDVASAAWAAIRSPDPTAIERVIAGNLAPLPALRDALVRFIEEFPDLRSGLSRTERQALDALRSGPRTSTELFRAVDEREERPFLGDVVFWDRLRSLADVRRPLIRAVENGDADVAPYSRATLEITADGSAVVAAMADHAAMNGLDRWLGGVRLQGTGTTWRRDPDANPPRLVHAA